MRYCRECGMGLLEIPNTEKKETCSICDSKYSAPSWIKVSKPDPWWKFW